MEEKEFDFKLTKNEIGTVLTALANYPYVLINKLSKAFAAQLKDGAGEGEQSKDEKKQS